MTIIHSKQVEIYFQDIFVVNLLPSKNIIQLILVLQALVTWSYTSQIVKFSNNHYLIMLLKHGIVFSDDIRNCNTISLFKITNNITKFKEVVQECVTLQWTTATHWPDSTTSHYTTISSTPFNYM